MSQSESFKFAITHEFPCNYLPGQKEQLLIALDERFASAPAYQQLMAQGFRRSGEQIYRPHCQQCQACRSIRIPVAEFQPSRGQRKILKRNAHLNIRLTQQIKPTFYPLYERYINIIHRDGPMYPASRAQFESFVYNPFLPVLFIEFLDHEQLVAVAVCDLLPNALSAVYTFYQPEQRQQSLGIFAILSQIELCQAWQLAHLYLGYQIDGCNKMNYKTQFNPHQLLINNQWI